MTGERLVPLFLALFLWSLHRALRDDRLLHFLAAGAAAAGMTYSKEVAVAIPTLFAVLMLVFGRKKLSRRAWTFCLFLLANAVVFVALYYFFAYRHMRSSYTAGRTSLTLWEILKSMFFAADLYAAAAALGAWRLYRLVVRGDRKHLFMDACLFSGLAYLLAYAVLKLPAPRYYTPALVAVIPALLYWAVASARFGRWVPATVSALFFAFFAYHHAPAAERQAKAVIQARRGDMAEVERLAADVRGGATVYYYQFQDLLHAEHQSTSVSYHYTVVQYFVNYALGRKFNDTTVLPLMLTTERIADDARVLFGMDRGRRDVELKRALEKFRLVDRGPVGSYRLLLATPRERNALPLVLRFAEDQSFHASGMQVFVKGSPRWTTDENAVVGLMFDPGRPVPSKLTVKTGAFLTKDAPEKTVEIFVNDISAGKWTLSFAANDHHQTKEHTLALPPGLMAPDGTFDIRFHIRPTPSPVSVGYNPDPRPLGLSLVELRLE